MGIHFAKKTGTSITVICHAISLMELYQLPTFNRAYEEEFEDTKGVIRLHILKKNRQHNGQEKKYKITNNDLQTYT